MTTAGARVVLVVDPGGSGAATLVGALRRLGAAVPGPEVVTDPTAREGSGQPRWAVELHKRLLHRARTQVRDARPQAWLDTAAVAGPRVRNELREWLGGLLDTSDRVVIHDPRLAWFLPLWRSVLAELGERATYVSMVRHPAAVFDENAAYDDRAGSWQHALAAWVNLMTRTEQLTRGAPRVFVSHDQLLADWQVPLGRLAAIGASGSPTRAQAHEVDDLVGRPVPLPAPATWGDTPVSPLLRSLSSTTWDQLDRMTDPAGDEEEIHRRVDALRAEYEAYYAAEEALARSALDAAWRRGARARRRTLAETGG